MSSLQGGVAGGETSASARRKLRRYDWPWVLLFLGPNLVLFLVFMAFPVFYGLYMSFFKWNIIGTPHFIGLTNYTHFFHDPLTLATRPELALLSLRQRHPDRRALAR